nr:TonB-dependent receptor plug domain-containing protein [Flavobacteriales bacterium]
MRSLALLPILICAASGAAQVRVEVRDGGTGEVVPYAHAYWHPLGEAADRMQVSDPNGVLLLPASAAEAERGLVLRLSFVGFTTRTDTLFGTGPHRLSLERATVGLQEFVVTAQYAPRPVDEAVQRMKVIGEEQVQRMAANDLGSALRNETNLRLGQDNVLGTSMSMQGLSGENVKILVDGVPVVGRLDGNIDLSQIDLTGIERIEVVEGPLSVSYGTNALAGTINLITRKRGRGRTFGAKVYAEHIGRLNTTVQGFWQRGGHSLAVSGGRNFFSGWNPDQTGLPDLGPAPADTNRWQQWKPREQYFGRLNYRWALRDWELGYKGEVMHDKITDRGLPRAPYFETAFDQEFTTVRLDNALFATRTWTGSTL